MMAVAAALTMTVAVSASAENRSGRSRGGESDRASAEERRAQFMERRIARIADKLELDAATAAKLSALMKSQMESRQAAMKTLQNEVKTLKGLVDQKAPEAEIAAQLQKITNARQAMHDAQMKGYAEIQALLGAEKSARLLIMQQKQMQEMRERVGQRMSGNRGERGGNRRGGER
jgi:Spy/CpxP family protein refolding chaperone